MSAVSDKKERSSSKKASGSRGQGKAGSGFVRLDVTLEKDVWTAFASYCETAFPTWRRGDVFIFLCRYGLARNAIGVKTDLADTHGACKPGGSGDKQQRHIMRLSSADSDRLYKIATELQYRHVSWLVRHVPRIFFDKNASDRMAPPDAKATTELSVPATSPDPRSVKKALEVMPDAASREALIGLLAEMLTAPVASAWAGTPEKATIEAARRFSEATSATMFRTSVTLSTTGVQLPFGATSSPATSGNAVGLTQGMSVASPVPGFSMPDFFAPVPPPVTPSTEGMVIKHDFDSSSDEASHIIFKTHSPSGPKSAKVTYLANGQIIVSLPPTHCTALMKQRVKDALIAGQSPLPSPAFSTGTDLSPSPAFTGGELSPGGNVSPQKLHLEDSPAKRPRYMQSLGPTLALPPSAVHQPFLPGTIGLGTYGYH